MGCHRAGLAGGCLSRRSAVEENLHLGTPQTAEFLQAGDELVFIIQRIQPQAEFGDQVMTINQVRHKAIIENQFFVATTTPTNPGPVWMDKPGVIST